MVKGFPSYHLLTEPLNNYSQLTDIYSLGHVWVTYPLNFVQVTCQVYPQDLYCDPPALIISHPHVCKPPAALRGSQSVVTKWDLERSRKYSPVAAYVAQSAQPVLPELRREIGEIQSLNDAGRNRWGESHQTTRLGRRECGGAPHARRWQRSERHLWEGDRTHPYFGLWPSLQCGR